MMWSNVTDELLWNWNFRFAINKPDLDSPETRAWIAECHIRIQRELFYYLMGYGLDGI